MHPGASAACPPSASRPPLAAQPSAPPCLRRANAPAAPLAPMRALVALWCRTAVERTPHPPSGCTRPDCCARAPPYRGCKQ
eukprot:831817-Prymnesium_polylepis.1